jgi:nitrous oxidase accessory protein
MQPRFIGKKCLAVGIILLFIGTAIIPSTAQNIEKSSSASRGHWLHVGGSGPGNYSKIQDAIDNANDGDTVFVYNGLYEERLTIRNAIRLIGESKNATIVRDTNTSDEGILIYVRHSGIMISGFTLWSESDFGKIISNVNSGGSITNMMISNNTFEETSIEFGIYLRDCDYSTITQNTFYLNHSRSIYLESGQYCVISNNHMNGIGMSGGIELYLVSYSNISNNSIILSNQGIVLTSSQFNTISNNYFFNNTQAICMEYYSQNNSILSNYIDNPLWKLRHSLVLNGIYLINENFNTIIEKNFISHCRIGIIVESSHNTDISRNTFMNNTVHARFYDTNFFSNHWNENYWGRPRILPKPIIGIKEIDFIYPGFIEFDWHPAKKQYDISGMR